MYYLPNLSKGSCSPVPQELFSLRFDVGGQNFRIFSSEPGPSSLSRAKKLQNFGTKQTTDPDPRADDFSVLVYTENQQFEHIE
jgi:hypothetical protein